jgi:hypothetical protein
MMLPRSETSLPLGSVRGAKPAGHRTVHPDVALARMLVAAIFHPDSACPAQACTSRWMAYPRPGCAAGRWRATRRGRVPCRQCFQRISAGVAVAVVSVVVSLDPARQAYPPRVSAAYARATASWIPASSVALRRSFALRLAKQRKLRAAPSSVRSGGERPEEGESRRPLLGGQRLPVEPVLLGREAADQQPMPEHVHRSQHQRWVAEQRPQRSDHPFWPGLAPPGGEGFAGRLAHGLQVEHPGAVALSAALRPHCHAKRAQASVPATRNATSSTRNRSAGCRDRRLSSSAKRAKARAQEARTWRGRGRRVSPSRKRR